MSFQDSGLFNPNPTPTQPQQGPGETSPPPNLVQPPPQAPPQPPPDQTTGYMAAVDPNDPLARTGMTNPIAIAPGTYPNVGPGTEPAADPGWNFPPYRPAIFIPNSPNRMPGEFGKPWWPITSAEGYPGIAPGPYMPSPWESFGVMQNAGAQLSRWGPPSVAEPAGRMGMLAMQFAPILDMISKGAFSRNYNAARLQQYRIQHEQMLDAAEQTERAHEQVLLGYGTILNQGEVGAFTPQQTQEKLREYAQQVGDTNLVTVLDNAGLPAAIKYLQYQDAKYRDVKAAHTSLRKATHDDSDAAEKSTWNDPDAGGGGQYPHLTGGGADQPSGGGPAKPLPSGVPKPEAGSFDEGLGQRHRMSPDEITAAHKLFNSGEKPDAAPGGDVSNKIYAGARDIGARFDNAAKIGNGDDPDAAMGEMRKIDPDTAQKIDDIRNYITDPKQEGIKGSHLLHLASQIDKNYRQQNYDAAKELTQIGKKPHDLMTRAGGAAQAYVTFLKELNAVQNEDQSVFSNVLEQWKQDHYGGEGRFHNLGVAMRVLVTQLNSVQSMSPTGRMTILREMLNNLPSTASPRDLRNSLGVDMIDSFKFVNANREDWERLGRKDMVPGISARDYRLFRDIARMNYNTGEVAPDSEQTLLAVNNKDPKNWASGLTDTEKQTPLRFNELVKAQQFIEANKANPDPTIQAKVQFWREQVGIVIGIGDLVPGVDYEPNARRR